MRTLTRSLVGLLLIAVALAACRVPAATGGSSSPSDRGGIGSPAATIHIPEPSPRPSGPSSTIEIPPPVK